MGDCGDWVRGWEHRLGLGLARAGGAQRGGQADVGTDVGTDVGGFRTRHVAATLRPGTVEQVRQIVASVPPGVVLYPISTGRNWGLGSRQPVADGAVVLDLGRLQRVRHLDTGVGAAVVEPGVTQGALAARLDGTPYMLNVTSSSAHTSVVGNALERGVGLRRQRCEDVAGLEVMLAGGRLMRLGNWPDEAGRLVPYRQELGPGLMPLFSQSNFGVVTAAVIRLLPRPQGLRLVRLAFEAPRLAAAVDELRHLMQQRLISGVLKIYPRPRTTEFRAYCCVDGDAELAEAAARLLMRRARLGRLFNDVCADPGDDPLAERLRRCLGGDPSLNEPAIQNMFGADAAGVDANPARGFLFFLPVLPFHGAAVARAHELVVQVGEQSGTWWRPTVNAISCDVIDLAISCRFPRAATGAAHQALDLLHERFAEAGWRPYRLDIDHMDAGGPPDVLRRLKETFDPAAVLAPGRYTSPATGPALGPATAVPECGPGASVSQGDDPVMSPAP
ncbi:FAD-binding oxidoreductase [Nonomuraea sp. NN258]|uniref:FAD-binding oxidoreductase n=1 Tax=Nonomuraea antri TaxID=2730852 RepID=UPI001567CBB6|nr:FAD-binding oxidoreductase [Nonomuraea antri]NRQ33919.1 FAD-binding oxidoreductase [Nonomuraea antri]